jgi:hypothetical protein
MRSTLAAAETINSRSRRRTLYRFKIRRIVVTWDSWEQLRRLVVLVDQAAEYCPPLNGQVRRSAGLVVMVGWSLLAGLVGPVLGGGWLGRGLAR